MKAKSGKKRELTPKQRFFVLEYLKDLNASEAAKRAGYSPKTCEVIGYQLLQKTLVQGAIQAAMDKRAAKTEINADLVLQGIANLACVDVSECYDEHGNLKNIHDIPKHIRLAIAGIDVIEVFEGTGENKIKVGETKKVRFWDKNAAFTNLGKHLKLFTDVKEVRQIHKIEDLTPTELEALLKELREKV